MDIEGHEVEVFESIIRAVRAGIFSARILFETHFPKYDETHHNMRVQLQELFRLSYIPKFLASTDESKANFHQRGYTPELVIKTDGCYRGIYRDISPHEAIEFICDFGGVRTVLLERV
jgi:hypothetical protein